MSTSIIVFLSMLAAYVLYTIAYTLGHANARDEANDLFAAERKAQRQRLLDLQKDRDDLWLKLLRKTAECDKQPPVRAGSDELYDRSVSTLRMAHKTVKISDEPS